MCIAKFIQNVELHTNNLNCKFQSTVLVCYIHKKRNVSNSKNIIAIYSSSRKTITWYNYILTINYPHLYLKSIYKWEGNTMCNIIISWYSYKSRMIKKKLGTEIEYTNIILSSWVTIRIVSLVFSNPSKIVGYIVTVSAGKRAHNRMNGETANTELPISQSNTNKTPKFSMKNVQFQTDFIHTIFCKVAV